MLLSRVCVFDKLNAFKHTAVAYRETFVISGTVINPSNVNFDRKRKDINYTRLHSNDDNSNKQPQ